MSLDLNKLEMVRELAAGVVQARCPACAQADGDRQGEHLRVYPDGRFGCCVHPKDREHRKAIFALAGDKSRRPFTIRVAGALAPRPTRSIKDSLAADVRTVRTANSSSAERRDLATEPTAETSPDLRTLRTTSFTPRAYARDTKDSYMYKDRAECVLSVLRDTPASHLTPTDGLVAPSQDAQPSITPIAVDDQEAGACTQPRPASGTPSETSEDIVARAIALFGARAVVTVAPGAEVPGCFADVVADWPPTCNHPGLARYKRHRVVAWTRTGRPIYEYQSQG
jgi:hypothetical protein